MQLTTRIHSFLKVIPQLVLVEWCALVMALSKRTGWGIFKKGKGTIISCQITKTACMMGWRFTNYRYANMDFVIFYSLIGSKNELLVISYDITCQWSQKLSQCQHQLPTSMRLSDMQLYFLWFAIPKFHISAHGLHCQSTFLFNYQPYMAHTDGENPEC